MIIPTETSRPIDKIAIGSEIKMKIKASAKAFKSLSNTIYPDKIAAPIRELGTNALDSHKEAKVDRQFLVHLPNSFEPYFSVRDYGTGISRTKMEAVYCTYFESDRTGSNDFTGGFGLGSKTPFCYSDTFTITSIQNGTKLIYTAYLDSVGEPVVACFGQMETTEENGLEVTFPVKPDDFVTFKNKAIQIYSAFLNKPVIIGADVVLKNDVYILKGNGWSLKETENNYDSKQLRAVMGNISYPLDKYKSQLAYENLVCEAFQIPIDLEFQIGELQPSLSREEIQYDSETNLKIKNRILNFISEFSKLSVDKIKNTQSYIDANTVYRELAEKNYYLRSIIDSAVPTWNGRKIVGYYKPSDESPILAKFETELGYTHHTFKIPYLKGKSEKLTYTGSSKVEFKQLPNRYFYNDDSDKNKNKIRHLLKSKDVGEYTMVIININRDSHKNIYDIVLNGIGISESDVTDISSVVLPIKPKLPKKSYKRTSIKYIGSLIDLPYSLYEKYRYSHSKLKNADFTKTNSIDTLTGQYFYIDSFDMAVNPSLLSHIQQLIEALKIIDKSNKSVEVLVFNSTFKHLKNRKNFIEFTQFAKEKIIKSLVLDDVIQNEKNFNLMSNKTIKLADLNIIGGSNFYIKQILDVYVSFYNSTLADKIKYDKILKDTDFFAYVVDFKTVEKIRNKISPNEIIKKIDNFINLIYPLLMTTSISDTPGYSEYIELIESKKQQSIINFQKTL